MTNGRKMSTMKVTVILGGPKFSRLPWAAIFPNSMHSSAHSRYALHTMQLYLNKLKPLALSVIVSKLHIPFRHQLLGTVLQGTTEILSTLDSDCWVSRRDGQRERDSMPVSEATTPKKDEYIRPLPLFALMYEDSLHWLTVVRDLPSQTFF